MGIPANKFQNGLWHQKKVKVKNLHGSEKQRFKEDSCLQPFIWLACKTTSLPSHLNWGGGGSRGFWTKEKEKSLLNIKSEIKFRQSVQSGFFVLIVWMNIWSFWRAAI